MKAQDNVSLIYIKVKLCDKEYYGMLDTGATLCVISSQVIKENNL